jgi:hypothetical protein
MVSKIRSPEYFPSEYSSPLKECFGQCLLSMVNYQALSSESIKAIVC